MRTITGTAADVPYTALAPRSDTDALIVTWHMMSPPRTNAAFAAALPMAGVDAWRVHLGMPWSGAREKVDAMEAVRRDPMKEYVAVVVDQAVREFPAALAELRDQLPVTRGPIGIVGGSLGGTTALAVLAYSEVPISVAALVNPAIRATTAVGVVAESLGTPYVWDEESRAHADRLDFVAQAHRIAARGVPLLVVNGSLDFPASLVDTAELAERAEIERAVVPGLEHPLAEAPGTEPAPQSAGAKAVDALLEEWFISHPPNVYKQDI